jgi:predicted protein tyrosine phosphatase
MKTISVSMLTICGLEELDLHGARGVTHVLSILDPDHPDPEAFLDYGTHHRTSLRFHDVIGPRAGYVMPEPAHVEAILAFGNDLLGTAHITEPHLLVHCHAGISRSTAAMAMLMAQADPSVDAATLYERLRQVRPKAWPNSRMIAFADTALGRGGELTAALGPLYRRQLIAYPNVRGYMRDNGRSYEVDMADAAPEQA